MGRVVILLAMSNLDTSQSACDYGRVTFKSPEAKVSLFELNEIYELICHFGGNFQLTEITTKTVMLSLKGAFKGHSENIGIGY